MCACRLITSVAQVEGAVKYLKKAKSFSVEDLEESCGKGVVVSEDDIVSRVAAYVDELRV